MEEGKAFQSLNLGFRELFRILVPGVYLVALLEWLTPKSELTAFIPHSVMGVLVAGFFLGLFGIGLQAHEKWYPYTKEFERWRTELNLELGGGPDQVYRYKYILETKGDEIKDRIHYFSSFYYMLAELSLFSFIAAICLAQSFVESLWSDTKAWIWVLRILICVAFIIQLLLLSSFREIKGVVEKLKFVPLFIIILWAMFLIVLYWHYLYKGWPFPIQQIMCLLVMAYLFSRLGAKYWKSVIKEQIIFVRERIGEINKVPRSDA